jgi:trans-aconitate methyltransferase
MMCSHNSQGDLLVSDLLETWIGQVPLGRALDVGAGEGMTSRWLASRGFLVDAVEHDPAVFEQLSNACTGMPVEPHLTDLITFLPPPETYTLIIAQAVLHFLLPTDLWQVADRLMLALKPGCFLFAEVYTVDEPGYTRLQESGAVEVEPNTFRIPESMDVIHYFAPQELQRVFASLTPVFYEESRRSDPESPEGYRAGAELVAQRPMD